MTRNIGNMDRMVRAALGVALIVATLSGLIGAWGWLGVVLLGTAAFSFCPLYAVMGTNSCDAPAKSPAKNVR